MSIAHFSKKNPGTPLMALPEEVVGLAQTQQGLSGGVRVLGEQHSPLESVVQGLGGLCGPHGALQSQGNFLSRVRSKSRKQSACSLLHFPAFHLSRCRDVQGPTFPFSELPWQRFSGFFLAALLGPCWMLSRERAKMCCGGRKLSRNFSP